MKYLAMVVAGLASGAAFGVALFWREGWSSVWWVLLGVAWFYTGRLVYRLHEGGLDE